MEVTIDLDNAVATLALLLLKGFKDRMLGTVTLCNLSEQSVAMQARRTTAKLKRRRMADSLQVYLIPLVKVWFDRLPQQLRSPDGIPRCATS